jgi:ATP-dependent RNA helicase DDX10/DBP4
MKRSNGCLFATDVVSRGIDFDYIHFIVQIDPPEDPDNYVHRIGRTARINRPGTVIFIHNLRQFCLSKNMKKLSLII